MTLKTRKAGSAEGRALAHKYGADIERTYTKALNGYEVEASETEAAGGDLGQRPMTGGCSRQPMAGVRTNSGRRGT
ncbi:hypothetical protein SVIOM74S_06054 [Streptomyces violarus]